MMVDFETGHFGDPAFDLGFFLSHLLLKACRSAPDHARYLALSERFRAAYDSILAARIPADELSELWARGVPCSRRVSMREPQKSSHAREAQTWHPPS